MDINDTLKFFSKMQKMDFDKFQNDKMFETMTLILFYMGVVSKNFLNNGKQLFLNKNYSSFRIKKIAFNKQATKNVEIKQNEVNIIKKNYRGKWESYKNQKSIRNYVNENNLLELDLSKAPELGLQKILKEKTSLRYLMIERDN